jgi:hypothetical protein
MTLEPKPLSYGLMARSTNGVTHLFISAERLWGHENDKMDLWLDTRWDEAEIGTAQTGPIRWEKHRE